MREQTNLYRVLGVPETAEEGEIKKAFRQLSKACHPDRNPGDPSSEEKTRQINRAYAILGNAAKRDQYDRICAERRKKQGVERFREGKVSFHNGRGWTGSHSRRDRTSRFRSVNMMKRDASAEEFYNRGLAWQRIKKYRSAGANYRLALSVAPKYGKAHLGLGEVYCETGETRLAVSHLTAARDLFSQTGDAKNLKSAIELLNNISGK